MPTLAEGCLAATNNGRKLSIYHHRQGIIYSVSSYLALIPTKLSFMEEGRDIAILAGTGDVWEQPPPRHRALKGQVSALARRERLNAARARPDAVGRRYEPHCPVALGDV